MLYICRPIPNFQFHSMIDKPLPSTPARNVRNFVLTLTPLIAFSTVELNHKMIHAHDRHPFKIGTSFRILCPFEKDGHVTSSLHLEYSSVLHQSKRLNIQSFNSLYLVHVEYVNVWFGDRGGRGFSPALFGNCDIVQILMSL